MIYTSRARRWVAAVVLIAAAAGGFFDTSCLAAGRARPNVVLFLVDDMGWRDCGVYGSTYYQTPHIDRFATQAMRFTSAYAQPLCSPTRASILTGQHSARHGITSATGHRPPQPAGTSLMPDKAGPGHPLLWAESRNYLDTSHYTLAEALRDAGYRTGHFGKWHLGITEPHWPDKHGFDVTFHAEPSPGPASYFSPYGVVPPGTPRSHVKGGKYVVGNITDGPDGEYITDRVTDEAIRFIAANKDRPFFLNLWHFGVHGPWGHKAAYTAKFANRTDPAGLQDNPIMASMLQSIDESLGRVLATLDELGLAQNTIVIFASDNGGNVHSNNEDDARAQRRFEAGQPEMVDYRKWAGFKPPTNNHPLREGKSRLYEGGTRVPLIVRWPGKVAAGATTDAIVGCIDFYPTILDLLGVAPNPAQKIDGISFAPVLLGSGAIARDTYYIWFPHIIPGVSVRKGDWKLIRRFTERPDAYEGTRELFNLKQDIGETTNLAGKMPGKVAELDGLIDAFVRDTGALYPQPNPAYDPLTAATHGLVAQMSRFTSQPGAVRVEPNGRTPYLGTAQVKRAGPLTLKLRARSRAGGPGKVQWKLVGQDQFPAAQSVAFELPQGGDWHDITVPLPIEGRTEIVRIYLPADRSPVDLQSIRYESPQTGECVHEWDFTKPR